MFTYQQRAGNVQPIAIRYGVDGPGIDSWGGEVFCTHPDQPTQPQVKLVLFLIPEGTAAGGVTFINHPHLAPRFEKESSTPLLPL